MLKFLGPIEKYVRPDGGKKRGIPKHAKMYKGRGSSKSIRKPIFFLGSVYTSYTLLLILLLI